MKNARKGPIFGVDLHMLRLTMRLHIPPVLRGQNLENASYAVWHFDVLHKQRGC
jgi:hypothetical protein